MTRRGKALLIAAVAIAALALGAVSTLTLAGWYQQRTPAAAPWTEEPTAGGIGPRDWGMGGVNVDSEFDYLTHMVAHHQEAVAAARQLERSNRPEMRALGNSIVTTQSAEITKMNGWLAQWYPGRSPSVGYEPMMRDLTGLTGDALDETFLRDMIPHHMVAVMMSQQLLAHGRVQHGEVADFARTVRDTQRAEIFQMRGYLTEWFGGAGRTGYGPGVGDSAWCGPDGSWGPGGMMGW